MNFEESNNREESPRDEAAAIKRKSSQDVYKGKEGVDWEFAENGFPRRIEKVEEVSSQNSEKSREDEIRSHQDTIEGTQEGINAAREKLGLPPTDEIPPSVRVEHAAIQQLQADQKIPNGVEGEPQANVQNAPESSRANEKESHYEAQVNRALQEITQGSEPLLRALKNRADQNLTPLCSPEQWRALVANFRALSGEHVALTAESVQNATDTINRIVKLLGGFGAPGGGAIRDNTESLSRLLIETRTFHISLEGAAKKLFVENGDPALEEKLVSLRASVTQLKYSTEKVGDLFHRLRQVVSRLS